MVTGSVKKVLAIVHQETSDPGLVGQVLRSNGYVLDLRCPAIGDVLPDPIDDYQGVIVFGGPMSANDDESLPHIRAELDWIPIVLDAQKPYLGICLGAQLLARVLGATVTAHPDGLREIGYVSIQPIQSHHNPLAQLTHVYHWHKEGFELPRDAAPLATGEVFPNQAFCYGKTAYGLQFHPEITLDLIDFWVAKAAEQLELPGAQPYDKQIKCHANYAAEVDRWLQEFLPGWLDSAQLGQRLEPQKRLSA